MWTFPFQVPAAARAGAIAPCDVTVPAQNTGLGPEKTSFFQALGITTKISRGTIEILVRLTPVDMMDMKQDRNHNHVSAKLLKFKAEVSQQLHQITYVSSFL